MNPPRSMSWWLTISASDGLSLNVLSGSWLKYMAGIVAARRSAGPDVAPGCVVQPIRAACSAVDDFVQRDSDGRQAPVRRKGIYLLPNLLTTGGLFAGFYSIVAAIDGNFHAAAWAIFIAWFVDGLDGRVARLTSTASDFGKEYDSLADMVSFGVAPAIVTYQWGVERLAEYGAVWGRLGWLAAFLYAAAAAFRLARFNANVTRQDKRYFQGLAGRPAAGRRA